MWNLFNERKNIMKEEVGSLGWVLIEPFLRIDKQHEYKVAQ